MWRALTRKGYVILSRAILIISTTDTESGQYYQMALSDCHCEPVMDYAANGIWPAGIIFQNRHAIIQTGSTQWMSDHSFFIGNGTYGIIDRHGNWID